MAHNLIAYIRPTRPVFTLAAIGGIPYNTDMSTYPGAIDEFRSTANIQGVEYNPDDTTTVFAEDTNAHSSAIVAIESTLGVNPAGAFETVADRLDAVSGSSLPVGAVYTTTAGNDTTPPSFPGVWECIATGELIGDKITYSWERTE